ncbi:MAG: hypothetical protein Q9227_006496 [Pyrenula ochraceoflavens]
MKLFQDIAATYAAMLDFSFTVQQHLSAGGGIRVWHAIKNSFNVQTVKFQERADRIAACKKKVIEESEAVFQEETLQQFGQVQQAVKDNLDSVKKFQKTSEEFYQAQTATQTEIQQTLAEIKASTAPRSPWERAVREFEDNNARLNPLNKTGDPLFKALNEKLSGACAWLFDEKCFKKWLVSKYSDILCIVGREGVGKSVLLASAVDHISQTVDERDCTVLYMSCAMENSGDTVVESAQSFQGISNTLIYQLYAFATLDSSDVITLENCNRLFVSPKEQKANQASKDRGRNTYLPSLEEAFIHIVSELGKQVTIVLDAVDRMSVEDQQRLFNTFHSLHDRAANGEKVIPVRILVGCRPEGTLPGLVQNFGRLINMEDFIGPDVRKKLDTELGRLPSWTVSQRNLAKEVISEKSGPIFKYIIQVAIPFVQEPFQGDLAERLKELLDGMSETYYHATITMGPNYFNLLHMALSWILFAFRSVKAVEILEAYSGIFQRPPSEDDMNLVEEKKDKSMCVASDIGIQQLRTAAGPFLKIEVDGLYQQTVKLQDASQIRRFCLDDSETVEQETLPKQNLCSRCQREDRSQEHKPFSFNNGEGHLRLAIFCVRHMRNPLFWKRYLDWPIDNYFDQNALKTSAATASAAPQDQDGELSDTGATTQVLEQTYSPQRNSMESTQERTEESTSQTQENSEGVNKDQLEDNTRNGTILVENDLDPADDSMDEEDRNDYNFQPDEDSDDFERTDYRRDNYEYRYEMTFWFHHIKKAQEIWRTKMQEIESNELWGTLFEELDKLAFDCPREFAQCQAVMILQLKYQPRWWLGLGKQEPWKPLHVAAALSLWSWAKHLLSRGESLEEVCVDRTPLQVASYYGATDESLLELLLNNGADPNLVNYYGRTTFHEWVLENPSARSIELFGRYKADFHMNESLGWSVMHSFALSGQDPQALQLVLQSPDLARPIEINAPNTRGRTPLQFLLTRQTVPLALLKAFLDNGAEVNHEDKRSERPLQSASLWGDFEVMKLLLPKVKEINDPDEWGRTALHQAAWNGHVKCVRLLIENNADCNVIDKHHRTPLFFACLGTSVETVDLIFESLCKKGISVHDINKPTIRDRTPLRQAAARGFDNLINGILKAIQAEAEREATSLINRPDKRKDRTALHCAAFWGRKSTVTLLLENAADVTLKDKGNKTALELAYSQWSLSANEDYESIISILIDADPAAATKDAELVVSAAANGSKVILKKLYDLKAILYRADRYGWTPLMLARRFGHREAEKFLARVDVLPTRWIDLPEGLSLSDDGLSISGAYSYVCISTDNPLSVGCNKFYFEVTLKETSSLEQDEFPKFALGFCTLGGSMIAFPGWRSSRHAKHARSWGYHSDDGALAASSGVFLTDKSRRYGPGDTIRCRVDLEAETIWFMKNGKKLEAEPFKEVRGRLFLILGF